MMNKIFSKNIVLFVIAVLLLGWICYDGLSLMVKWWERDEYSHGYMIPLVAAYLFWQKRAALAEVASSGSLLGIFVVIAGIAVWLLGELSAIYTIVQYAFLIGLLGLILVWVGLSGFKVIWASWLYLIFMVPLPNFLYFSLSQELQLISSAFGVAVIRWFDISVFLEGNVIDLGVYQLQVVEACSGLRYLFPLMSFGFLIAYIYRAPFWQRLVIFLSTIPITVLMNSFRIGVIGVTVEHFGIAAAEGFLHDFEGWFVFMACLGVLLLEIWLLYFLTMRNKPFNQLFDLDFGANNSGSISGEASSSGGDVDDMEALQVTNSNADAKMPVNAARKIELAPTIWVAVVILIAAVPGTLHLSERQDKVPDRRMFSEFPLIQGEWIGRERGLDSDVLGALKLTDYFIGDYRIGDSPFPVNFYTAWYQEQRKGASIHSPKSCLPGGGWVIQSHTIESLEGIDAYGQRLKVNRVLMQMGEHQQLVYYWFQGRGRNITNEYLAKWYMFWDSLVRNRTDGALIRLITYVPEGSDVSKAELRINSYAREFYPIFSEYIPD